MSIGIFDSGFGGLTVMREIVTLLPQESIVYLADTARLPYGTKSKKTISSYLLQALNFFLEKRVKLIVIACHTASAYALEEIQKRSPVPVLGIISAGRKEIQNIANGSRVAVIGTSATISSGVYQSPYSVACPLLVSLVEEGFIDHPITRLTIHHYLDELKVKKMDYLLLACTHFPLLEQTISKAMGKRVKLIDPAKALARDVKELLQEKNLLNANSPHYTEGTSKIGSSACAKAPAVVSIAPGSIYHYFVTDNPQKFKQMGEIFLKISIASVEEIKLE